jgi:hypothetical protein
MLVVADHNPTTGSNYKLVRWDTLASSTDPKLPNENEYDAGSDAGSDAGVDAGPVVVDAGRPVMTGGCTDPDAGFSDAGRRPCTTDAGQVGHPIDGGDTVIDPDPPKTCCGGGPSNAFFPGGLLLLWTFRFRRRKT